MKRVETEVVLEKQSLATKLITPTPYFKRKFVPCLEISVLIANLIENELYREFAAYDTTKC